MDRTSNDTVSAQTAVRDEIPPGRPGIRKDE
jgi:hypothetical protein